MIANHSVVIGKLLKGLYSAALAFLGSLAAVLQGSEPFGDVTPAQWVTVAAFTLGAFGGTFGLAGWAGPQGHGPAQGGDTDG